MSKGECSMRSSQRGGEGPDVISQGKSSAFSLNERSSSWSVLSEE